MHKQTTLAQIEPTQLSVTDWNGKLVFVSWYCWNQQEQLIEVRVLISGLLLTDIRGNTSAEAKFPYYHPKLPGSRIIFAFFSTIVTQNVVIIQQIPVCGCWNGTWLLREWCFVFICCQHCVYLCVSVWYVSVYIIKQDHFQAAIYTRSLCSSCVRTVNTQPEISCYSHILWYCDNTIYDDYTENSWLCE